MCVYVYIYMFIVSGLMQIKARLANKQICVKYS